MSEEPDAYDEPNHGTQILWGRVIVLLLALALAFWLGTTFGGDPSAQTQLQEQRAEIARLESEVAALEAEVAAVDAGAGTAGDESSSQPAGDQAADDDEAADGDQAADGDEAADGEPSESSDGETGTRPTNAEGDAREYVVQSGDSLAAIAQEVYGDPTLWREIAEANDIEAPYSLTVGDTLVIPAEP